MVKAIIFDCFGVLILTEGGLNKMLVELEPSRPEKVREIVNIIDDSSKGSLDPQKARKSVAKLLGLNDKEYSQMIKNSERKNTELLSLIANLKTTYKIGLLSNILKDGIKNRFSDEELRNHFDAVVASGEIGYAKPDAQSYEITASKLGVRLDECIMVDDREDYCEGAERVGMRAILYKNFEQLKADLGTVLANSDN